MDAHTVLPGEVRLAAGCKINMGLSITGRRADGYHLLDSVFFPLDEPHDELFIRETGSGIIEVECAVPGIDARNNTLTKAWEIFRKHTGEAPSLRVRLVKGIPWGAGLGGGSSDAAALLRFLKDWLDGRRGENIVSPDELAAMAGQVGADVPFFLSRRPMRVTGIGDVLTPVAVSFPEGCSGQPAPEADMGGQAIRIPGREILLVTPDIQVSTPWAYKAFDAAFPDGIAQRIPCEQSPSPSLTKTAEEDKGVSLLCAPDNAFVNDLETVVFPRYPELADIKRSLLEFGAAAASMSGSGSSLFGIFSDEAAARSAGERLSKNWPVHHLHISTGM